ncbi:inositol monophosphatase family protein [Aerococcaceae bacterium WGS1372]
MDYQLHHRILVWMEQAAKTLRQSLNRDIEVEEKQNAKDLVTEMDKATEKFFIDKINQYYPEHRVIGEEGFGDKPSDTKGIIWVIDPIDGTLNFVKSKNHFGIMLGIFLDGEPLAGYIYDVMNCDLYYGIVGEGAYLNNLPLKSIEISHLNQSLVLGNVESFSNNVYNMKALLNASLGARSYGSAAMEIIGVIRGEASLYFSAGLRPWDFAAGYAICLSMGYYVSKIDGSRPNILERSPILFAHPNVYAEALELLSHK